MPCRTAGGFHHYGTSRKLLKKTDADSGQTKPNKKRSKHPLAFNWIELTPITSVEIQLGEKAEDDLLVAHQPANKKWPFLVWALAVLFERSYEVFKRPVNLRQLAFSSYGLASFRSIDLKMHQKAGAFQAVCCIFHCFFSSFLIPSSFCQSSSYDKPALPLDNWRFKNSSSFYMESELWGLDFTCFDCEK